MDQMIQIIQSAILGMLTVCLGFFIKRWIQSLDEKMNQLGVELKSKTSRIEYLNHVTALEKRCEKRDNTIRSLVEGLACKCDEDQFLAHSHTDKGKIILN